ncbi:putative C2H2 finger domain protein [Truncatella angustata]|uniref:C2H2 finger domain protein n=1 Tax=Truncatella angustata TaxID=152316 RepID=A0A9P8UEH1_9PEZI|nr:putative C2H2 finger domain protein [Truncatella angustata]KAH6648393.1 putative C2H2 finger domain protein [Truncatella angustata]KAH8204830.1 hypothetical protein TruAng_001019 [Truncatella angustata]
MVLLSESSSEISSLSSDSPEPENEYDSPAVDEPALPPSKRQKIRDDSRASSSVHVDPEPAETEHDLELDGDISTDTSGDVPNSPINAKLDEEEAQEQVTVCAWDGCDAGDQGNMDRLVDHIHADHIESRQKKYTCEWIGCTRKSMPHASGYALKAHMRSHTREKPFYCYLPECDRAFTRSDALAKHMRTVHETEALRPSDPVPKSLQHERADKAKQNSRLKIVLKKPESHQDDSMDDGAEGEELSADFFTQLTEQHGFSGKELQIGQADIESLWRLCVANAKWAGEEGTTLREQCKELEELYRQEWLEKEVLLEQIESVEIDWWTRRHAVLSGAADIQVSTAAKPRASVPRDGDPDETDPEDNDVGTETDLAKSTEVVAAD